MSGAFQMHFESDDLKKPIINRPDEYQTDIYRLPVFRYEGDLYRAPHRLQPEWPDLQ